MFYAISWLVVFCLLALWSVAAWAFHTVTVWTVSNAGVLTGGVKVGDGFRMPNWLATWVPPEFAATLASAMSSLTPAIETVMGWAPALAGGLTLAVWVVWAIGSALLIALGLVLSGAIAMLRRPAAVGTRRSMTGLG